MVVCSIVFQYHCIKNKDIDPYVATGLVAKGVIEGAKTSPVSLKSKNASASEKGSTKENDAGGLIKTIAESSISGSGTRLVLSETDAAIQDALDNGGKFILVHPEVASQLAQGNIDVFLIYVTGLMIELESKIAQVDFVNANVDELLHKWKAKPSDKAPIHVRLMLWLDENEEKYGYQQSGKSWKVNS